MLAELRSHAGFGLGRAIGRAFPPLRGLLQPPIVERGWADKADSRPPLRGPGGWGGDW